VPGLFVRIPVTTGLFNQFAQFSFTVTDPEIHTPGCRGARFRQPVFFVYDEFDYLVTFLISLVITVTYVDKLFPVLFQQSFGAVFARQQLGPDTHGNSFACICMQYNGIVVIANGVSVSSRAASGAACASAGGR
jgi:hypothetical protein